MDAAVFGKNAETLVAQLAKGDHVRITGYLQQPREGSKQVALKITATEVKRLSKTRFS